MAGLSCDTKIWIICMSPLMLMAVTSQPIETGYYDNRLSGHGRCKRSMPAVLGKLLAGAKLVMHERDYKLFSRPGGYAQARADFDGLRLTGFLEKTQTVRDGTVGNIGDRTVMLTRGDNGGGVIDGTTKYNLMVTLPVSIDRIKYMNKTNKNVYRTIFEKKKIKKK